MLVGSSEIADVVPISDRTIYLLGKRIGTTNVSLIDAEKRLVGLIDIEVRPTWKPSNPSPGRAPERVA